MFRVRGIEYIEGPVLCGVGDTYSGYFAAGADFKSIYAGGPFPRNGRRKNS